MNKPRRDARPGTGKKGSEPRNAVSSCEYGGDRAAPIKNAVGMRGVKNQGYAKIKGTVSG